MTIDIGKLVLNVSRAGATLARRQRDAKRIATKTSEPDVPACCRLEYWEERVHGTPSVVQCSYCGAPGQRIGARCEYCQVAVSR